MKQQGRLFLMTQNTIHACWCVKISFPNPFGNCAFATVFQIGPELALNRHDDSKVWEQAGGIFAREKRFPRGPRDKLAQGRTALDSFKLVDKIYDVDKYGPKAGMARKSCFSLRGAAMAADTSARFQRVRAYFHASF